MKKLKLKNLPLKNTETRLAQYKKALQDELFKKGISFPFKIYISEDWFCPDGSMSIAMPFYLFNEELIKLEKQEVGYVEGVTLKQRMKLLRHELGHCIDNAYALRKNKQRQRIFGSSRVEYPSSYTPKKYSRKYVHYLGDNYAQSHPDEDFAETFATWLDPHSNWREKYRGTPALKKLLFMDKLMHSLRGKTPILKSQRKIDPIERLNQSVAQYFFQKRRRLGAYQCRPLDEALKISFGKGNISVAQYLRQSRRVLAKSIAQSHQVHRYKVQWAIDKTIERAEKMDLYGTKGELQTLSPHLISKNFRYLSRSNLLKYYL